MSVAVGLQLVLLGSLLGVVDAKCVGGEIAACVIVPILLVLIFVGATFALWKTGKVVFFPKKKSDEETGRNDFATPPKGGYSNEAFEDTMVPGADVTVTDEGMIVHSVSPQNKSAPPQKTELTPMKVEVSTSPRHDNQRLPFLVTDGPSLSRSISSSGSLNDQAFSMDPEVVSVCLQSEDIIGMGFTIDGTMREGIRISQVNDHGPAKVSGKVKTGDRIISLTISFANMVYEDALTILSYASPYAVTLKLEKSSGGQLQSQKESMDVIQINHPLYHSQSLDALDRINQNQPLVPKRTYSEIKPQSRKAKAEPKLSVGQATEDLTNMPEQNQEQRVSAADLKLSLTRDIEAKQQKANLEKYQKDELVQEKIGNRKESLNDDKWKIEMPDFFPKDGVDVDKKSLSSSSSSSSSESDNEDGTRRMKKINVTSLPIESDYSKDDLTFVSEPTDTNTSDLNLTSPNISMSFLDESTYPRGDQQNLSQSTVDYSLIPNFGDSTLSQTDISTPKHADFDRDLGIKEKDQDEAAEKVKPMMISQKRLSSSSSSSSNDESKSVAQQVNLQIEPSFQTTAPRSSLNIDSGKEQLLKDGAPKLDRKGSTSSSSSDSAHEDESAKVKFEKKPEFINSPNLDQYGREKLVMKDSTASASSHSSHEIHLTKPKEFKLDADPNIEQSHQVSIPVTDDVAKAIGAPRKDSSSSSSSNEGTNVDGIQSVKVVPEYDIIKLREVRINVDTDETQTAEGSPAKISVSSSSSSDSKIDEKAGEVKDVSIDSSPKTKKMHKEKSGVFGKFFSRFRRHKSSSHSEDDDKEAKVHVEQPASPTGHESMLLEPHYEGTSVEISHEPIVKEVKFDEPKIPAGQTGILLEPHSEFKYGEPSQEQIVPGVKVHIEDETKPSVVRKDSSSSHSSQSSKEGKTAKPQTSRHLKARIEPPKALVVLEKNNSSSAKLVHSDDEGDDDKDVKPQEVNVDIKPIIPAPDVGIKRKDSSSSKSSHSDDDLSKPQEVQLDIKQMIPAREIDHKRKDSSSSDSSHSDDERVIATSHDVHLASKPVMAIPELQLNKKDSLSSKSSHSDDDVSKPQEVLLYNKPTVPTSVVKLKRTDSSSSKSSHSDNDENLALTQTEDVTFRPQVQALIEPFPWERKDSYGSNSSHDNGKDNAHRPQEINVQHVETNKLPKPLLKRDKSSSSSSSLSGDEGQTRQEAVIDVKPYIAPTSHTQDMEVKLSRKDSSSSLSDDDTKPIIAQDTKIIVKLPEKKLTSSSSSSSSDDESKSSKPQQVTLDVRPDWDSSDKDGQTSLTTGRLSPGDENRPWVLPPEVILVQPKPEPHDEKVIEIRERKGSSSSSSNSSKSDNDDKLSWPQELDGDMRPLLEPDIEIEEKLQRKDSSSSNSSSHSDKENVLPQQEVIIKPIWDNEIEAGDNVEIPERKRSTSSSSSSSSDSDAKVNQMKQEQEIDVASNSIAEHEVRVLGQPHYAFKHFSQDLDSGDFVVVDHLQSFDDSQPPVVQRVSSSSEPVVRKSSSSSSSSDHGDYANVSPPATFADQTDQTVLSNEWEQQHTVHIAHAHVNLSPSSDRGFDFSKPDSPEVYEHDITLESRDENVTSPWDTSTEDQATIDSGFHGSSSRSAVVTEHDKHPEESNENKQHKRRHSSVSRSSSSSDDSSGEHGRKRHLSESSASEEKITVITEVFEIAIPAGSPNNSIENIDFSDKNLIESRKEIIVQDHTSSVVENVEQRHSSSSSSSSSLPSSTDEDEDNNTSKKNNRKGSYDIQRIQHSTQITHIRAGSLKEGKQSVDTGPFEWSGRRLVRSGSFSEIPQNADPDGAGQIDWTFDANAQDNSNIEAELIKYSVRKGSGTSTSSSEADNHGMVRSNDIFRPRENLANISNSSKSSSRSSSPVEMTTNGRGDDSFLVASSDSPTDKQEFVLANGKGQSTETHELKATDVKYEGYGAYTMTLHTSTSVDDRYDSLD